MRGPAASPIAKIMAGKGWTVLGKPEIYPTGTTDFSMGLLKAKRKGPKSC